MDADDWWWRKGAQAQFTDPRINQLWRNHLLAFAMLHQDPAEYAEGYCAVLYHDDDNACTEAITIYRGHLRHEAGHTLLSWPLGPLLRCWGSAVVRLLGWDDTVKTSDEIKWLTVLRQRYVDLSASENAWRAFQRGHGPS